MNKKILIIDDDSAVRGAFKLILDDAGYDVDVAENGFQGIEKVQTERPDLIFLDLRMPGIDGVETLRRLKTIDATLNVYIVTAFAEEFMAQLQGAQNEGLQFELASKPLSSTQIRTIARAAQPKERVTKINQKLALTLYVVSLNDETRAMSAQITRMLTNLYEPGQWSFETIEVLAMPEKALENDIFATPMLVRDVPPPVLKLLGDLSKMPLVLTTITSQNDNEISTVII